MDKSSNSKLRKQKGFQFLFRMSLFLLILFLLDLGFGKFLRYSFYQQDSGLLYRTTYAIDSTTAEMLIFGSSTANHHYYPGSFEDRLHVSLYNAGRDGNSIFYHYAILSGVLKRYSPKIAILDFNIREFKKDEESYDRISSLLPYYQNHPEIRPIVQMKSPYEKYKLLSKVYPFNSIAFTIAIGNSDLNKNRRNNNDEDGYVPLIRVWNKQIAMDTSSLRYDLDNNKIKVFTSFIQDCIKSKVRLYIVVSPRFIKYRSEDTSIAIAKKITNEFNIPFYDFSSDSNFLNHAFLFADQSHLNAVGAKKYSGMVIEKVLQDERQKFN